MSRDSKVWLNGEIILERDATVPLLSHAVSRASAIFEIFGIHEGPEGPMAFRMDEHLKRLTRSADALEMAARYSTAEIAEAVRATARINHLGRGLIKIMAYWGSEPATKLVPDSNLDVAVFAMPASGEVHVERSEPITACLSKWRKIHPETVPVGAKACANYLNGYLARKDAIDRGYDVGIMLSTDGFLAEGSRESVFVVKDGILKVPPLESALSSITRMSILQAAPKFGLIYEECEIAPAELIEADELFTASTSAKVVPIIRIEDRILQAPGPMTQQIASMMNNIIHFKDARFLQWFQPLT